MKYNGKELYLSSVSYTENNTVCNSNDILCTMIGDNWVHDEINNCNYPLMDFSHYRTSGLGIKYVMDVCPISEIRYQGMDITSFEELVEVAKYYNMFWANISIPFENRLQYNDDKKLLLVK